ncbi:MAG: hypothetical protein SPG52_04060 [Candidatus Cryptobacteroides sp.]|nr:hypothetical protein [Candidatus Cryptobacteroides sp.]
MTKKINYLLLALAFGASAFSSCVKEEGQETDTNKTIQVEFSIGDEVKGFTDMEGVKWEVGDQVKYAGGVILTSDPLTAEQISEDGYTASFTFDASLIAENRTGWFVSTKCHPGNNDQVEFTLGAENGNSFIQDEAGKMNSRYLFLHSGTSLVNIEQGVKPSVKAEIAGTIFRVIPYTTTYNDEKVLSVKMSSKTNLVGTVGYDRGAGTYKGVNEINWKKYNFVKATLGTPFSLTGVTKAEDSKGIYLAVAATPASAPLDGYSYVVETDKATYTFNAMDKQLAVGENVVKNVFLNLDKGVRTTESGYLKYGGALTLTTIPAGGCTDQDAGYWQALTSADGNDPWTVRINSENAFFYSGVQFSYKDKTSGKPVDWISVKYGGGDLCHWIVTAQENKGAERSVIVTATYPDVKGYTVIEESKTKELTLSQEAVGSNKKLTFFGGIGDATIDATGIVNKDLGYCVIDVDGVHAEDWSGDSHKEDLLYGNVTITPYVFGTGVGAGATVADWLTVGYGTDSEGNFNSTHIFVTAQDNTGVERKAVVYCEYKAPEGYEYPDGASSCYKQFIITQKAGLTFAASFNNVYAETIPAAGATITAATLSINVNGISASDVKETISTYGLSLTADKGASVSVASDGTVTLTVPENKYKNGGVEYTITLKKGSETLATASVLQKEGTEEAVIPSHTFSYTIYNNAVDGSKGTGFGKDAGPIGDWYRIENIVIDGTTYTAGTNIDNLVANTELMTALQNQIFSFGEITEEDVQVPGSDPLTTNPESFVTIEAWSNGGAAIYFRFVLTANDTGVRRTFKVITKDGDGNVTSTIVYFQNA